MQREERQRVWDPEASVGFWINRASRLLLRAHEGRLRKLGFTMGQLPVLVALEDGGALSQIELARRARVEQPTMAEMLVRMERDGIIERTTDPNDKRASLVSLTRRAHAKVERAKSELLEGEHEATRDLDPKERAQLIALAKRVVESLELSAQPVKARATRSR